MSSVSFRRKERLALIQPILLRHRLKLVLENHKDQTCDELVGRMKKLESEWIGVLVDTGNNLALLVLAQHGRTKHNYRMDQPARNFENATHPIPQEAFDWYDEYAHGIIDRRTFVTRLSTLTTAGFTTAGLLAALLPEYANAEQVLFTDPDIKATFATFESPQGHGECRGYLVRPTKVEGKAPTVLVVHENRGLNPYVKDVARRVAKAGFIAFAPDALHPLGGYPGNDDDGRAMQGSMDKAKLEQDFIAAAKFIKGDESGNGKLGAVGFCFGGYVVNMLAAAAPDVLNAGVPFYGTPAAQEIRKNIKCPLLIQLGELDERVNASWPDYEKDLKANKVAYTMHMYPKANHGFHNDSTPRYDPEQAELAWERTIAFFKTHLA